MKKSVFGIGALSATVLLIAGASNVLAADEGGNVTGTPTGSVGSFEVTAGDLNLAAVPNFDFGSVSVEDLGQNGVTDKENTLKDEILKVTDFRGLKDAAWTVQAKMSNFKLDKDDNGIAGSLTYKSTANGAGVILATENKDVFSSTGSVSDKDTFGTYTASDNGTTLNIDPQAEAKAGKYNSDITWTLVNTVATASDQGAI